MMIGHHRYRFFYFLGRTLAFGMAGLLAGEIGAVLNLLLSHYYLSAVTSFLFGGILLITGFCTAIRRPYPGFVWLSTILSPMQQSLSLCLMQDRVFPTLLFGFFTIFLPCGQTLIVFSACALTGDWLAGLFNGLAFALLTSPSLILAMHAHTLFKSMKNAYNGVVATSALAIGLLAFCRGFAEMGWISHWILNPEAPYYAHIIIY